jgi:LysR family transcriptional regulator, hydrogen peroxide-inducible genes activator
MTMNGKAGHRPTLRQLAHLVALADAGHFGRAAAASHVTQSTLSASIKELEETLQAPLVDRTRRKVVFTPLGLATAERARAILDDTDALVRATAAESEPLSGPLRMGVIPTIGPFLLPAILPKLRRAYPKLRLYLVEDLTERLVAQLHDGKLDVALLALPYDCGNVESRILFQDTFCVALPREHRLATTDTIKLRDLKAAGLLLLKEGHCLREHAMEACRLTDPRDVEPVEATSLHTLVQMVDNGLGVTLLPQLAIDAGILRGTRLAVAPLAGGDPARDIGLIWRKGTGRQGEFEVLADEITKLAAERRGAKS